jgi:hypothetical protein
MGILVIKTIIWALLKSWYPYVINFIITAWFLMYVQCMYRMHIQMKSVNREHSYHRHSM